MDGGVVGVCEIHSGTGLGTLRVHKFHLTLSCMAVEELEYMIVFCLSSHPEDGRR